MLNKLTLKNLGCFDDQGYSIDFSEETMIAGPNNTGKSMALTGVNLVRQYVITASSTWVSDLYNLVSFRDAVYAHDTDRVIEIALDLSDDGSNRTYELSISKKGFRLRIDEQYTVRREKDSPLMKNIWYLRPNRSPIPYSSVVEPSGSIFQPLKPDGSNVINYLLEKWTDKDPNWNAMETWLKKIDPDMSEIKTPVRGSQVFLETMSGNMPINLSLQGSGFQSLTAIAAAIVFSPAGSTIIIEEPEVYLHPESQEFLVDMINQAVVENKKQVIFSTHSTNILLPFFNDIGANAAARSARHVKADRSKFSMWTFKKVNTKVSIEKYPLQTKTFRQFKDDFKQMWG